MQTLLALLFLAQLSPEFAVTVSLTLLWTLPSILLNNRIHKDKINSDFLGSRLYPKPLMFSDPFNTTIP